MGRILGLITALITYACIATGLAVATAAIYLVATRQLNAERMNKIAAVLRGEDSRPVAKAEKPPPPTNVEQPSYEEQVARRDLKARQLELREQSLKSALQLIESEKVLVLEERDRNKKLVEAFRAELKTLREGAFNSGKDNVRQILEGMKPKQAKEQLLKMIDAQQMSDVVDLVTSLPASKQAKVLAEFKTADESQKLNDILQLIRQSVPEVSLIDRTQGQVNQQ